VVRGNAGLPYTAFNGPIVIFKKSAKFHVVSIGKFKLVDFVCPCKECDNEYQKINLDLISGLIRMQDAGKLPIGISSCYRCKAYNHAVGGLSNSPHLDGLAADIYCVGRSSLELAKIALIYGGFRNIGLFKNGIHVDKRPWKGRLRIWNYPGAELAVPEFREIMNKELEQLNGNTFNQGN